MDMQAIDLTGRAFGRLTVKERAKRESEGVPGGSRWVCQCECGGGVVVWGGSLKSGGTKSCGCLRRETCRAAGLRAAGLRRAKYSRADIESMLAEGRSNFTEIARGIGCSRERIRQIAKSEGITGRGRSALRAADRILKAKAAKAEAHRLVIDRWESDNICCSKGDAMIINLHLGQRGEFRCGTCGERRPLSLRTKGPTNRCKGCNSANSKRSRDRLLRDNPELVRARQKLHNARARGVYRRRSEMDALAEMHVDAQKLPEAKL